MKISSLHSMRPPFQAISTASRPFRTQQSRCPFGICPAAAGYMSSPVRMNSSISETMMSSRRAKITRDFLSPMPSHLLDVLLSDMILTGRRKKGLEPSPPASGTVNAVEEIYASPSLSKLANPGVLPQGHMLVYFPLQVPASQLAADGADRDHIPSADFTRRLWAGGEVIFSSASSAGKKKGGELVLDGRPWTCREEIEHVEEVKRTTKVDPGGAEEVGKYLVHLRRRYSVGHWNDEEKAGRDAEECEISERRSLVFTRSTEKPPLPTKNIKHPHPACYSVPFFPTATHLFHFSALTYNAHAIHINPLFATSCDNHPSLLVHGPLTLSLMLRVLNDYLAREQTSQEEGQGKEEVVRFTYRNYAPLYVDQVGEVKIRAVRDKKGVVVYDVWIENAEGGMAVRGTASLR